ncbi:MAG: YqgE/AlgH family protein [Bacteroidales bacterium]|jgi:putative transcriptional regulator|nr:YqgE/AlgH family protein [Bacteroidales bacterium]
MYLNFDFLNINHKQIAPEQGRILISEPMINDTYFHRSVILITEHNENGSVGFVLNKAIDLPINELMDDFPVFEAKVFVGGPVSKDTIHFLHTLGNLVSNSKHVISNIYWGGDFDQLKNLIKENLVKANQVLFFMGYVGWSKNQLQEEIDNNSWLVSNIDSEYITNHGDNIWEDLLFKLGEKYKVWANMPQNSAMN